MSKHPGFYKSEKRRKELDRKKKHDKKLEEKKNRKPGEGGGPEVEELTPGPASEPAAAE